MRGSWAKHLEVLTNFAVLVAAVALLVALISARFTSPGKTTFERGLHQGQVMARVPGVDYGAAPLQSSRRCGYGKT